MRLEKIQLLGVDHLVGIAFGPLDLELHVPDDRSGRGVVRRGFFRSGFRRRIRFRSGGFNRFHLCDRILRHIAGSIRQLIAINTLFVSSGGSSGSIIRNAATS